MTELTINVSPLEGIDLESTPPCEIRVSCDSVIRDDNPACGLPSAARIRFHCNNCDYDETVFVCAACLDEARHGATVACGVCWLSNYTLGES